MQTFSAMEKDLIIFFQRRTSFFSALKYNNIELRSEYVNDGNKINDDFVFNNDYIPTGKREMGVFFSNEAILTGWFFRYTNNTKKAL